MKPPETIQIGPYRYAVRVEAPDISGLTLSDRESVLGHIDGGSLTIALAPEQAPGSMRNSLLHEVLHGVFDLSGVLSDPEDHERVVTALSPSLLDTLRRNPELVDYLMAGDGSE